MEALFHFWQSRCGAVSDQARAYLKEGCQERHYRRDRVIRLPDERFPYLCIVLEGLAGGYHYDYGGRRRLRELVLPMDFFTGTKHVFSRTVYPVEYVALQKTRLLLLLLPHVQEGQRRYPEIGELIQVLKQRKILLLRALVEIYQEERAFDRYSVYAERLPDWPFSLPLTYQANLLRMSLGHIKKMKKRYLTFRKM